MAAEDYFDVYNYYDSSYWDARTGEKTKIKEQIKQFHKRVTKVANENRYKNNKFYVGSNSIFDRNWGKRTLPEAIKHAQQLMEDQDMGEVFIVKIVKVVRRKQAPIEVVDV